MGSDDYGNKYYSNKKNERWVVYSKNIEATKITSDWYLWMHHTIDKIPDKKDVKHSWQKKHKENQTGTPNSFKPVKIKKITLKKSMRLGNSIFSIYLFIFIFSNFLLQKKKYQLLL